MMLHDEMVHKFDQETNEADANSNLFERIWGSKDEKKEGEGEKDSKEQGKEE